ncbi:MAG: M15 family metallopeptidase [Bacteroidia bacterium]|nr:M15 family metallopeptidase [Bacteroidia bacterium]
MIPRPLWISLILVTLLTAACNQPREAPPSPPGRLTHLKFNQKTVHPLILEAAAKSFVRAYPQHLKGYAPNTLILHDGSQLRWNPSISSAHFHALMSAGRLSLAEFFKKVYGSNEAEARQKLKTVNWLPKNKGIHLVFSGENGAAEALRAVSQVLDTLPQYHKYLSPCSGTFNWRPISGTRVPSAHSFGIAIDLNSQYGDYWRWAPEFREGKTPVFRNRIPLEIVDIFEAHGFVWGGRWPHYDTMHFEYRPEVKLYNEWFATSIFHQS